MEVGPKSLWRDTVGEPAVTPWKDLGLEQYAGIYKGLRSLMTPNQADEHEPWQLAAMLDIDWNAQGAEEKYAAKRKAEAGTMEKRLAKLAAMGRVGSGTKGMTVEKPGGQRSRQRRK